MKQIKTTNELTSDDGLEKISVESIWDFKNCKEDLELINDVQAFITKKLAERSNYFD